MAATCRCDPKLLHRWCCTCVPPDNRKVQIHLLLYIRCTWLTRNHTESHEIRTKRLNSLEKTTKSLYNPTKSHEVATKSHQYKPKSHRITRIPNTIKRNHKNNRKKRRKKHSKSRDIATNCTKSHEIM